MKHDVFISHAHKDEGIADGICGKLESAGLKCWIATQDISTREDRTEVIRNAIESSRAFVLVLSGNTNAAPHIEREIAHASYMRRIIIPFRLADTLPRREILFYLGSTPLFSAHNPPAEKDLEALAAHIKGLMQGSAGAASVAPRQSDITKTTPLAAPDSWFGALKASPYRTLGILKWVTVSTFLCAAVLFLWFTLRQTQEWASLAESHSRSLDRGFSVSPTPSPQAGEDAIQSKQASTRGRFDLWQATIGVPAALAQGPQDPPLDTSAQQSVDAPSPPQRDVTPGNRVGGQTSEPRSRHVPPVTRRVSNHHPQFPGTQVKEARKIADLENQRDSLRSRLKETEANLLATQKNADFLESQRDELRRQLNEIEEKARVTQKNADIMASDLNKLRDELKETENRALTAEKNEELVRTQLDALQARLQGTEREAQTAQKNTDLATRQLDALQSEMDGVRERARLAESNANLATSQRDAMEVELKKKEEGEAQEKKSQPDQHGTDPAELVDSAPDTHFREAEVRPAHRNSEFAQTLPPNPGQNAKPASLTQTLDASVQPPAPLEKLTQ